MKYGLIIFVGGIFISLVLFSILKNKARYTELKIENTTIKAEIADSYLKQIKGLMFKKGLKENEGMLFVFNEDGFHGIWMMNMSFPIDIIWIDKEKKVVDIVKNAQPCKWSCPVLKPEKKSRYVLEVSANFTEKHKIKIGSTLEFKLNN